MNWKYQLRLVGGLTGTMWMPACPGAVKVDVNLNREAARMDDPTLRDLCLHLIAEKGGDFQDTRFTGDTYIEISRVRVRQSLARRHSRLWELTKFKSVADMIAVDIHSCYYDPDDC